MEARKRMTIDEMDFSNRTFELLKRRDILTAADLMQYTEEDLRKFSGQQRVNEVKQKLAMYGLELRKAPTDIEPDDTADGGKKKSLEEVTKKLESMGLLLREET